MQKQQPATAYHYVGGHVRKYEYTMRRFSFTVQSDFDELNKLGRAGWELKAISPDSRYIFCKEFPSNKPIHPTENSG